MDKLVQYVKGGPATNVQFTDSMVENSKAASEPVFVFEKCRTDSPYRGTTINSIERETEEKNLNPFNNNDA